MRVIHGIWAHGALRVWGEDPELPPAPRAPAPAPAPHPFACPAAELADLLAALPGPAGEAARKAVNGEITLRLPSAAGPARPLASPDLVRPGAVAAAGRPAARTSLASWRVPVLVVAPAAALDLLRAAAPLGELAIPGSSMPYLSALAAFAEALAARGRVLPVLAAEDGGYAARWRPVLDGADAQRAADLAAAMPASCRAAGGDAPALLLSAALDEPGRRGGAGPPAGSPPARQARPYARPHSFGRTVRGRTDQH